MSRAFVPPTECPVCGKAVPRGAKACPGCGADERSGWNEEDTRYDGLDLPEDAFRDEADDDGADDAPPKSFTEKPVRRGTTPLFWLIVAGVLLVVLVLSAFIR